MGLLTMDEKQRAKWRETRKKGRTRFVAIFAVLFTVVQAVTMSLFDHFVDFRGFQPQKLKFEIPLFLLSGILGAVVMWFIAERQYKNSTLR